MRETQTDRILRYLREYGSITAAEAMQEFGVYRLAARIADIKKKGYIINSEMETGTNRFGEETHYKRYFLTR